MNEGIKIITEIPGPKSRELHEVRTQHVARGLSTTLPIYPKRTRGALVEDVDGNVLIDMAGGMGVFNVGHSHPAVVEAVKAQADQFVHAGFSLMMYEPYVALCKKLNEITPGNYPKKSALFNSGAEAVEAAVRIARYFAKRPGIVCFEGGYHGRTLLTATMTSKAMPFRWGSQSIAPDIYKVPYAYCYRCVFGQSYPGCNLECVAHLDTSLEVYIGTDRVAAAVAEPVCGEGGCIVPPPEFLPAVKKVCEKYDLLFVVDEIQTGFARTGRLFAIEHFGVEPDLMAIGKAIGGGVPVSAVTGRADIMDSIHVGGIGGTMGGNPLGCAAGLVVVDIILREDLAGKSRRLGALCFERLTEMKGKYPFIGDVRGLGSMLGMEIVKDRKTKEPGQELASKIQIEACKNGAITMKGGLWGNLIRLLLPLVITEQQLQQGLDALEKGVASAC